MREKLKAFIEKGRGFLSSPELWKSLDVDYFPPRVERLYMEMSGYRYYLHVIHYTGDDCLFHKHRWPSAVVMLHGSYEMGLAYSEKDITSEEAYKLPIVAKMNMIKGTSYEMVSPGSMHYVKPHGLVSYSLMVTGPVYDNAPAEALERKLDTLSEERKFEILDLFTRMWPQRMNVEHLIEQGDYKL